ncbi:thiamine pyrophosphate-binding protein [Pseudomonas sp. NPDC089554]|uniref:thiamine pyrophosphate-binding protein n=1 Tax=Pseudomonas sp. NPDC089554 TaxID=3390653 RepID=UPI003D022C07
MSQAQALPQGGFKQWWLKWRFHLNILLILIPLGFMPLYFSNARLFLGESGLGATVVNDIQVDRWTLDLAEFLEGPPRADGQAGYFKFITAACGNCTDSAKAIYLRIGKPRSLRAAGSLLFGSPYRMGTSLPIPANTRPDAEIWITIEGWDGSMHQASVPLAKVSPTTVAWLEKQGGKK